MQMNLLWKQQRLFKRQWILLAARCHHCSYFKRSQLYRLHSHAYETETDITELML